MPETITRAALTPVLSFPVRVAGIPRRLHLKAEWLSPLGSSKGRTAAALLDSVADRVDPAAGVIESTSGNLGAALAALCARRGQRFTAVVDPRTSRVLVERMLAHGARVLETTRDDGHGGYLLSRLALVQARLRDDPRLVWTDQYHNPANPRAHAAGTAPELAGQAPGAQEVFVPVSTGGTLAGFRRHADETAPGWRCVGVDVTGSAALGGPAGPRVLSGIGASRPSSFLPAGGVDAEHVTPDDAAGACDWALDRLGLGLGASAGAALAAALRRMRRRPALVEVACVCPDGPAAYAATFHSAAWRAAQGIRPVAIEDAR